MKYISSFFIAIAMFLYASYGMAATEKTVTINGMFYGLNCMLYDKNHPHDISQNRLQDEPDIVITDANGKYYYVPNLNRELKEKYYNNTVRLTGVLDGNHSIRGRFLEIKDNSGKFVQVWSRAEEQEQRRLEEMH